MEPTLPGQDPIIPAEHPHVHHPDHFAPHQPKRSRLQSVKNALPTVLLLLLAPLIAVLLTLFVFQSYVVDGPSMETTLQHNDRLIVVKTGKTWASLFNKDYIPDRGEVVVFKRANDGDRQLIKRVIGLPGDRIVIKNGQVTVYNTQFPDGFNPDKNANYRNDVDPFTLDELQVVVPEGEVFVMGDNRDSSLDSRAFGTIPAENIAGTLALRIYPFNKFDSF